MCFTPVLFTKWNDCIFHSKQGQNQDPAFSHILYIGQKIVPAYVFVGQFCLLANLQIFISFIEIIFCQKSTWLTSCLLFIFLNYIQFAFKWDQTLNIWCRNFWCEARLNTAMSKSAGCRQGNLYRETISDWQRSLMPLYYRVLFPGIPNGAPATAVFRSQNDGNGSLRLRIVKQSFESRSQQP